MRKSELLFLLVFTIGRSAFSTRERLRNLADGRKFAGQQPAAALIFAVVVSISHWISAILRFSRTDMSMTPRILMNLLPYHGCDMSA